MLGLALPIVLFHMLQQKKYVFFFKENLWITSFYLFVYRLKNQNALFMLRDSSVVTSIPDRMMSRYASVQDLDKEHLRVSANYLCLTVSKNGVMLVLIGLKFRSAVIYVCVCTFEYMCAVDSYIRRTISIFGNHLLSLPKRPSTGRC